VELPSNEGGTAIEQMTTEFLANFTRTMDVTWDMAAFIRTINDLQLYSLLAYDRVNRSYSIHPLVHQWTRTVVDDPRMTCSCAAFLLASLVIREFRMADYMFRCTLLNYVDSLLVYENIMPRLSQRFLLVYKEAGCDRSRDAEILAKVELEANINLRGREHRSTLTSMVKLANTYHDQGRWDEAEVLQRGVLEVRKRVQGSEHHDTLTSMANLAAT
jgi:hypothetical protein